jgi:starch synthase
MRVLFVAAEVAPYMKTGGLADVAGALPAALRAAGHDVRVVMPLYRALRERGLSRTPTLGASFVTAGDRTEELRITQLLDSETPLYLLDIPAAFDRTSTYGDGDDYRRFILFSRGVLAMMQHLREVDGWQPEVVHAHDWHGALVANYIKSSLAYTFGHIATVFTIHNLAYQGQFAPGILGLTGLTEGGLIEDGVGPGISGTLNFMARGIAFSDVVTTVSPTYANEIMGSEYGERLDGLLRARRNRVAGILNGIDPVAFNPAADDAIAEPFSADDPSGKAVCKAALQEELSLPVDPDRPLLAIVSRLVEQKGVDLLDAVIPWLMKQTEAQLVVLGSGASHLEDVFRHHAYHNQGRITLRLGFNAPLAQRIYAGSDMFLMPSRFEPCGLGQMIALRYGSVPIVRATGGLADTVREGFDGNGFRFHPYDGREFASAIGRALDTYRRPTDWALLRERGMREDNSWTHAAAQYAGVYQWAMRLIGR